MTPFKIAITILETIWIIYLIFYCISSFINIFTGGGVVDERMDFILSLIVLIELAKKSV